MTGSTTPAGEALQEAVAPTDGALKVARENGGVNGELCERIAWALDPEAFQIWEREHVRKHPGSGPTWDQMAVHGRRARARATAASLVAGPIASELARLTAERDEARELIAEMEDQGEIMFAGLQAVVAARDAAEAALTTIRAEHAAEIARWKAQTPFVVTNGERGEDERFRMWSGRAWVWVKPLGFAALFVRKRDANQILPDGDPHEYPDRIRALTLKEAGHE